MKKTGIIIALLLIGFSSVAQEQEQTQEKESKFDFRFGTGFNFSGAGDRFFLNLENELNYKISKRWSTSVGLNYGKDAFFGSAPAYYLRGSVNIFVSLFRNTRKNDFRTGIGVFYGTYSSSYNTRKPTFDGSSDTFWEINTGTDYGACFIFEDTYSISKKFLLGFKTYMGETDATSICWGAVIKVGMKL